MISETIAFAPANISCIFKIYEHKNPRWMGSYGVGFTLNEGVIVSVKKSNSTDIFFNNKKINFPTVIGVINKLTQQNLRIYISSKLPLGCGFGLSGASAMATAYAINKLLNLKKTKKELAIVAHIAEVENKTGLGDVVNQYFGGFFAKFKPSSYFVVKRIPINSIYVYCSYYSKLSTKAMITNLKIRHKINDSATIALNKIKQLLKSDKNIQFRDIIKMSKEFSVNSGLLKDKKTMKTIKKVEKNNENASMIMLGNAVFSDKFFKGAKRYEISNKGARLL